ncbi:MAG: T9SS type A sorting domain-containing protein [Bacteroidia bacterium]|nr:T9SS type A sorting domain-containing protein [Bacteroidia bacterium]
MSDPRGIEEWYGRKLGTTGQIPFNQSMTWLKWDEVQSPLRHGKTAPPFEDVQELGPFHVGGRTRSILIDQSNENRVFAGSVSGGLWLSEDGCATWKPVNDQLANLAVSCITQSPLNSNIMYFGTGEAAGASSGIPGDGVFKSTDSGKTFVQLPSTVDKSTNGAFTSIWAIEHSPVNKDMVYVATALGGLWRSTDAGKTWKQVYSVENGPNTVTDIELFTDGSILIASYWDGVYRSASGDSGTYERIVEGLSKDRWGRGVLAKCRDFPYVVYLNYARSTGESFHKSSDGGKTWKILTSPSNSTISYQGKYCVSLGVHPTDTNNVLCGGVGLRQSFDGGHTWAQTEAGHADQHEVVSYRGNDKFCLIGNDGGIYRKVWDSTSVIHDLNQGYNVTQFYAGSYFPSGKSVLGGTQDNGSYRTMNGESLKVGSWDGGFAHVSLQNENLGYHETQKGGMTRCSNIAGARSLVKPIGSGITEDRYFISPFEINPMDGTQLYFVSKRGIWRSLDSGDTWNKISGKLSAYALYVEDKVNPTLYFGGKQGAIYRIDSAQTTTGEREHDFSSQVPQEVTNDQIGWISGRADRPGELFICFTNYSEAPKIYKVSGAHTDQWIWTNISGNMPSGLPVNGVYQDRQDPLMFYAATDFGLYYSIDGGTNWQKEHRVPNVAIHQLRYRVKDQSLFLFTHGRGNWYVKIGDDNTSRIVQPVISKARVYPNPIRTKAVLNIKTDQQIASLLIYDVQGRQIRRVNHPGDQISLGSTGMVPGTYYVVIHTAAGKSVERLVVY